MADRSVAFFGKRHGDWVLRDPDLQSWGERDAVSNGREAERCPAELPAVMGRLSSLHYGSHQPPTASE